MKRRKFLTTTLWSMALASGVGSPPLVSQTSRPLRILMLGGTDFVGPWLVETALQRGHEVTLFNRGITNPDLFPNLEKLRGNRYPDRDAGLSALGSSRTWDVVFDTWQQAPGCVEATVRLLRERVGQYVYVSSIASYRDYRESGLTEQGPMLAAAEHIQSFSEDLAYPLRKRAAEQAVENSFECNGIVLRCTSIQGPHVRRPLDGELDPGYWGYRFLTGRSILAPDDPTAVFQLIDVRDLALFTIRAAELKFDGAFNMVGPERPLPLKSYLEAYHAATGNRSELVWVDREFLKAQEVRPWDDIRNWIPGDVPEPGFYRISNERALGHGLSYRPVLETIRDGVPGEIDGLTLVPPETGMSLEREEELIKLRRSEL